MKNKLSLVMILMLTFSVFSQNNKKFLIKAFNSKDSSDYYFFKAKNSIINKGDEAEYYFAKNAYCNDNNKLDSAIVYGKIALKKLEAIKKINSIYYVNNNLAKSYSKLGKYELEKKHLHDNLNLSEKNNNSYWELNSYHSLSNLHHDFEEFEQGVNYGKKGFNRAMTFKEKDLSQIRSLLNVIAINYDDWNKPEIALYYHKKVFEYTNGNDTLLLSNTYNNIGNTYLKLKNNKVAKSWFNRAITILKIGESNYTSDYVNYSYATIYTNLATLASDENDKSQALKLFNLAFNYATKSNEVEKLRDYYYQSARFNKKYKNIDLAFKDQENYLLLRDSIYNRERAEKVNDLETKYQVEKKEKEILQSKIKISNNELQIKKQKVQFLILALIALVLIIIVYLIYRQQRLINKQQAHEFQLISAIDRIESQNQMHEQRLSISRDLHDNIGAQLTFIISSVDNLKFGFKITDDKINTQLEKINNFTKQTIVELRDTIWAMNSNEISFQDIEVRIFNFIENAKQSNEKLRINFEVESNLATSKLNSLAAINVYRIIQEAINNALKYSKCNEINIKIGSENNSIKITISDNGKGFDLENVKIGNGILNMQKRSEEINGTFAIISSTIGTEITLTLNQN